MKPTHTKKPSHSDKWLRAEQDLLIQWVNLSPSFHDSVPYVNPLIIKPKTDNDFPDTHSQESNPDERD